MGELSDIMDFLRNAGSNRSVTGQEVDRVGNLTVKVSVSEGPDGHRVGEYAIFCDERRVELEQLARSDGSIEDSDEEIGRILTELHSLVCEYVNHTPFEPSVSPPEQVSDSPHTEPAVLFYDSFIVHDTKRGDPHQ